MARLKYVDWDTDHAGDAIAALNRAAQVLRSTADERRHEAVAAAAGWEGSHRRPFDEHIQRAVREAEDLAEMYKRRALQIEQLDGQARRLNDQRRREHEAREQRERAGQLRGPR